MRRWWSRQRRCRISVAIAFFCATGHILRCALSHFGNLHHISPVECVLCGAFTRGGAGVVAESANSAGELARLCGVILLCARGEPVHNGDQEFRLIPVNRVDRVLFIPAAVKVAGWAGCA